MKSLRKGMITMKKKIMLPLILILCFISACNQSENEEVSLYEKEFVEASENWEVTLHLRELSKTWSPYKDDEPPYEQIDLTMKYLKEIDEGEAFHYKLNYGEPVALSAEPNSKITLQNQAEYTVTTFQQRIIEEVCFGTLTLVLYWEDPQGESQEESFVYQDNQNPQCQNIILMAPRG